MNKLGYVYLESVGLKVMVLYDKVNDLMKLENKNFGFQVEYSSNENVKVSDKYKMQYMYDKTMSLEIYNLYCSIKNRKLGDYTENNSLFVGDISEKNVIKRGSTSIRIEFLNRHHIDMFGKIIIVERVSDGSYWIGKDKKMNLHKFRAKDLRDTSLVKILECYTDKVSLKSSDTHIINSFFN